MTGTTRLLRAYFTPLLTSLILPMAAVAFVAVAPVLVVLTGREPTSAATAFFTIIPVAMVTTGRELMSRVRFALGMGSTRRAFWSATTVGFVLTSGAMAATALALYAVETATGHWFLGVHVFDWDVPGVGAWLMPMVVFVLSFLGLQIGGWPQLMSGAPSMGLAMVTMFIAYVAIAVIAFLIGYVGPATGLWHSDRTTSGALVTAGLVLAAGAALVSQRLIRRVAL